MATDIRSIGLFKDGTNYVVKFAYVDETLEQEGPFHYACNADAMMTWCKANHIPYVDDFSHHLYFANEEDAMLCYMRFITGISLNDLRAILGYK